jgi:hypothetical protein
METEDAAAVGEFAAIRGGEEIGVSVSGLIECATRGSAASEVSGESRSGSTPL